MSNADAVHTWSSLEEQVDALVHVTLSLLDNKQEYVVVTTSTLEGNDWSSSVRLLAFDPSTGHIDHIHAFRLPTTAGALTWHAASSLLVVGGDDGDLYFLTFDCTLMKWTRVLPPHADSIGHDDLITSVDASTSTFASGSWDLAVKLWDVEALALTETLQGHCDKVWAVQWQPQSTSVLASASQDRTVRLWDVRTPSQATTTTVLSTPYATLSLTWQPHNDHGITAGLEDGSIYTFDMRSPHAPSSILANQHAGCVYGVKYNDEGTSLASYGDDAAVHLYSVETDKVAQLPRYSYTMHTDYVRGFAWLGQAKWAVSSSFDKSVHFWQL
ncbi:hypothetical protein H257_09174 [Aphanomyces astaci]|uniref:Uncharacterized protein n=1 Tax=Aphanomyces astaci TaxID=112090 RepID=W4GCN3_APHAT|nr:hypothetical protein H257_09174 [Aphanomyces astaci]ETV76698.1 hypothetical protein H257_09174 [Aphanomyces astaci]|eukprot:XP_009833610.1 hypothetical protein H257_09174 [Aphanomyces astaci]